VGEADRRLLAAVTGLVALGAGLRPARHESTRITQALLKPGPVGGEQCSASVGRAARHRGEFRATTAASWESRSAARDAPACAASATAASALAAPAPAPRLVRAPAPTLPPS